MSARTLNQEAINNQLAIQLLEAGYQYLNAIARKRVRLGQPPIEIVYLHESLTVMTRVQDALLRGAPHQKNLRQWQDYVREEIAEGGELD